MVKKKENESSNHKRRQFQDKTKYLKKNKSQDKDDEMQM